MLIKKPQTQLFVLRLLTCLGIYKICIESIFDLLFKDVEGYDSNTFRFLKDREAPPAIHRGFSRRKALPLNEALL